MKGVKIDLAQILKKLDACTGQMLCNSALYGALSTLGRERTTDVLDVFLESVSAFRLGTFT
jgi:dissimilatory sulfite reductase (desulfoviridin) alpha/beta subunit